MHCTEPSSPVSRAGRSTETGSRAEIARDWGDTGAGGDCRWVQVSHLMATEMSGSQTVLLVAQLCEDTKKN